MIQTMDVHEYQDLDGLPNVPSSRYRNSDIHDANIEDGNPANWIGKDFDDQELRDRINPTRRGEGRDNCTAPVWKYFEIEWIKEDDGIEISKHFNGCKLNPYNISKEVDNKQQKLSFTKAPNGEGHVYTWKHDDTRIQLALLGHFTIGELPFKFIENEAFIEFVNALNGRVKLPSRHKISRDVVSFY
ncbi:unnamed protein product [Lactuca saligna]|uniref:Uncharacterized protein n=1 Tax=Lactuca saligna TaxID=75948 RepID=A0AA35ZL26_LACSI|nr:unnamed protein product [Lactuca saligna]